MSKIVQRWDREREHFDAAAETDGVFRGNNSFDYLNHPCIPENHLLGQLMNWKFQGLKVLDIGCGVGEATLGFAQRGAMVTGIDVAPKALGQAQRLVNAAGLFADIRQVTGYALPFPDASFDLIYGNGVLHHLELKQSLPEIRRVMKESALGFFIEPKIGNPLISVYRWLASSKRSADEKPLGSNEYSLLRSTFSDVNLVPYQFATQFAFFKMLFIDRLHPNKTSYWREPILHPDRFSKIYQRGTKVDDGLRKNLPSLFSMMCWNHAVVVRKSGKVPC